eukprot:Hpha_TRINITY_DN10805_c0_g1::TRINITY_DN10805_c0_g1_i1::g.23038::m.23038
MSGHDWRAAGGGRIYAPQPQHGYPQPSPPSQQPLPAHGYPAPAPPPPLAYPAPHQPAPAAAAHPYGGGGMAPAPAAVHGHKVPPPAGSRRPSVGREMPDLVNNPKEWFTHWDSDSNGDMSREELAFALMVTFAGVEGAAMGEMVDKLWELYQCGSAMTKIKFLEADGVADTLGAQLHHRRSSQHRQGGSQQSSRLSDYEFVKRLGEGAQGVVYCARKAQCPEVVLKIGRVEGSSERAYRVGAAILAQRLDHPNLVRYSSVFIAEPGDRLKNEPGHAEACGRLVIEMPLYVGDLRKAIESRGRKRLTTEGVWRVVYQICSALHYLHEPKMRNRDKLGDTITIIHRDIKPENVLLRDHDGLHVAITDFEASGEVLDKVGLKGSVGTAEFQAPESFSDDVPCTAKCDMFGLGALIVCLVSCREPILRCGGDEMMLSAPDWKPDLLRQSLEQVFCQMRDYKPLLELCVQLLSYEPERRPSAGRVLQWIEEQRIPSRNSVPLFQ